VNDDVAPRLLDVKEAARYLGGVSTWTIRSLVADGHLRPVRLPSRNRGELGRRLLFDRADLDAAIAKWKEATR
jgi:excisionase family DNA binding protein